MRFFNILKINLIILAFLLSFDKSYAASNSATTDLSFTLDEYIKIESVTSPVLVANITDNTGNLYQPISSKFKVITNTYKPKYIYLRAYANTDAGREEAIFEANNRAYIAFTNVAKLPKSQALANCKMGAMPNQSPGVVAYPVQSIIGAGSRYLRGKNKFEIIVDNGTTFIDVNIGTQVLRTSFAPNDSRGCYQAILSLTETDI